MKQLLLLIRLFFVPFNGWPWLFYLGLAMLPVVLLTGIFYPTVAFGLAVWDYVLLLAVPFTLAPRMLRAMLSNRPLMMAPGLQRQVIVALLLFTLMQSTFIAVFASLYQMGDALTHFRNAAQLFIANSIYIVVMQYAVTTRLAVGAVSIFPVLSVAVVLYSTQGRASGLVQDPTLAALVAATLCVWLLSWFHAGKYHRFRQEHESMLNFRSASFQRPVPAQWLVNGGDALVAPDATLMLGYPATLMIRFRVILYTVFVGPVLSTALLVFIGFGAEWDAPPSALELLIGTTLLAATFGAYQGVEWVARLRLIWLRSYALRDELWWFLEKQLAINLLVLLTVSLLITCCGLLFTQLPAGVLLHYPLLVLLFNAFYGYYIVCARTGTWSPLGGLVLSLAGAAAMAAALWFALKQDSRVALHTLEVFLLIAAATLRLLARSKLVKVDWLRVKPTRGGLAQTTSP